jgi:hypothetical protein
VKPRPANLRSRQEAVDRCVHHCPFGLMKFFPNGQWFAAVGQECTGGGLSEHQCEPSFGHALGMIVGSRGEATSRRQIDVSTSIRCTYVDGHDGLVSRPAPARGNRHDLGSRGPLHRAGGRPDSRGPRNQDNRPARRQAARSSGSAMSAAAGSPSGFGKLPGVRKFSPAEGRTGRKAKQDQEGAEPRYGRGAVH